MDFRKAALVCLYMAMAASTAMACDEDALHRLHESNAPPPKLSLQEWTNKVTREMQTIARQKKADAIAAGDLAIWLAADYADRLGRNYENIHWLYSINSDVTGKDLYEYFAEGDTNETKFRKEAEAARLMAKSLEAEPADPANADKIRFQLKRLRNESGKSWEYGILLQVPARGFEPGVRLPRSLRGLRAGETVFFKATQMCVNHACDDLYKAQKTGTLSVEALFDIHLQGMRLGSSAQAGPIEYKDPITGQRDDTLSYVMQAVGGNFSNETNIHFLPNSLLGP